MKVDHVLLLSAGKGTRMGKIGKVLPKVLWPIFEKSLLELQVEFARELSDCQNIYINIFHEKEKILKHLSSHKIFQTVNILEELEPLDIGGAVHNLAKKVDYQGNLLILNSDQFLYFNKETFQQGLSSLSQSDGVLFSYDVNSNELYGALEIEEGFFKKIKPNKDIPRNTIMRTYTGMSIIKLEKLEKRQGRSHFFETVANPNGNKLKILHFEELKYWDFGTLKRYYESMFGLLEIKNDSFKNFLIKSGAIDTSKVTPEGYFSNRGINLSDRFIPNCGKCIIFDDTKFDNEKVSINGFKQVDIIA